VDQKTIDLIHGDIDGLNSPEEQRELLRRLEASPEARQEHARMRVLCQLLDSAPACEPPQELTDSILAAIPRPAAARVAVVNTNRPRRGWMGAAVALAATVAGVAVLLVRVPAPEQLDVSALAGTIGRPAANAGTASLGLDSPGISGAITAQRHERGFTIDIDLDADRPISVVADSTGVPLELAGFLPLDGSPARVSESGGSIRVLHSGKQHYTLVLGPGSVKASSIDVMVYEGEVLIKQGRLELPSRQVPQHD
jgi:hypothetical protein